MGHNSEGPPERVRTDWNITSPYSKFYYWNLGHHPWYEKHDGCFIFWSAEVSRDWNGTTLRPDRPGNWICCGADGAAYYIAEDWCDVPPAGGWRIHGALAPAPTL